MSDLKIEFDWLSLDSADEVDRALAASIGVAVGDQYVTRIDDLGARTIRNQMRGSALDLALWFAANWWRLRWEPASAGVQEETDWRLAHSMAAAGGGYIWPDAILSSDGESIEIRSRPAAKCAASEPIRYIGAVDARVPAAEFERSIDGFMSAILSRLVSCGVKDGSLNELWQEVMAERRNKKVRKRRKLEAMAGYDPDEAPDEMIKQLIQDKERLGKDALEEVAAQARHETSRVVTFFAELSRSNGTPQGAGVRGSLPEFDVPSQAWDQGSTSQRAMQLARAARAAWGFGQKPVLNKQLAELLGTNPLVFTNKSQASVPMPFALRSGSDGTADFYFDSPTVTTRRFAVGRILGDYLASNGDRLLPVTKAVTARQKFQRVFAQEFLCPLDALLEKLGTPHPGVNDIEAAAEYFHVSPLMIRTTLVNTGNLGRDALNWED